MGCGTLAASVTGVVMTLILALDASSLLCSVALGDGDQQWNITELQPRRHAQRLLPMVDEVIAQAGMEIESISAIAYGRGPGSFTGIRIAAAVMQGLAMALDVPVAGISSLQAVAQSVFERSQAEKILVVMDAHMGEVFWGIYQRDGAVCRPVSEEKVGAPELCLQNIAVFDGELAGDGLALEPFKHLSQQWADRHPDACDILKLALVAKNKGLFAEPEQHQPVYLRDSVAWKKLDEQPSLLKRN